MGNCNVNTAYELKTPSKKLITREKKTFETFKNVLEDDFVSLLLRDDTLILLAKLSWKDFSILIVKTCFM